MVKSFKNYITEEKQVGIIYHYTSIENALRIVDMNRLNRSTNIDEEGEPDYISFTRDKHFHRHYREGVGTDCRFIVDGTKLSRRYKFKPHNYFSFPGSTGYLTVQEMDEQEERLLGKDIVDFKQYILKFQIFNIYLEEWLDFNVGREGLIFTRYPLITSWNVKGILNYFKTKLSCPIEII